VKPKPQLTDVLPVVLVAVRQRISRLPRYLKALVVLKSSMGAGFITIEWLGVSNLRPGCEEVARLTAGGDPVERLGLPGDTGRDAERTEVLRRLEDWRIRAAHPPTDRTTADACEIIAQAYERLHAELATGSNGREQRIDGLGSARCA
jgi:hypothetical protein